ncbi:cyclin-dependent protein kinase-activating kinase CAK1 [Nakaseomyces bracarensis]|uniref:cyclin-dependent protein kinase-activating kinase CAK1 n=1 Tax=Nakaseomyces bracarensis TaxID=273131 RepID=UPI003871CB28
MISDQERQIIAFTKFARLYKDGEFAVKVLSKDHSIPPHNVRQECQILKKLSTSEGCLNVVKLIEERVLIDDVELVFEYYPFDLYQFMESCYIQPQKNNPYYSLGVTKSASTVGRQYDNKFDIDRFAKDFMLQIANGLKYIHKNSIIHRDIKPQNIMLRPIQDSFRLIIIDFGISYDITNDNSAEPANSKITDVSTSIYKAPELLFSVKNYSFAIDIWAFMIIISQWFTDKSDTKNYCKSCFDDGYRPGDMDGSEIKLIFSIFENLGVPSIEQWPELKSYGSHEVFEGFFGNSETSNYIANKDEDAKTLTFKKLFSRIDELKDKKYMTKLLKCLSGMCIYESTKRITASEIVHILSN